MKLTRSLLLTCLLASTAWAGVIGNPSAVPPPPPPPAEETDSATGGDSLYDIAADFLASVAGLF